MIYSRRTVVEALKLLAEKKSYAAITEVAFTHDLMEVATGGNVKENVRSLTNHLLSVQNQQEDMVNEIVETLINEVLNFAKGHSEYNPDEEVPLEESHPALIRALRIDGFVVRDFKLVRQLPESITLSNHQNELFMLLEKHNFDISRGHLEQVIDAHAQGRWASSNGQLRSFMETLFNDMADRIFTP